MQAPGQVQRGSGEGSEGSGEGLGGWCRARSGSTGFRRRRVQEALVQSQVRFNRVPGIFGNSSGVVESSSGVASGTSFGQQISGTALGSSFVNSVLEQLWGAAMRGEAFDDAF